MTMMIGNNTLVRLSDIALDRSRDSGRAGRMSDIKIGQTMERAGEQMRHDQKDNSNPARRARIADAKVKSQIAQAEIPNVPCLVA